MKKRYAIKKKSNNRVKRLKMSFFLGYKLAAASLYTGKKKDI